MSNFANIKANDSNPAASVGVQSWSRGAIFPAIISVVEEYDSPMPYGDWLSCNRCLANAEYASLIYDGYLSVFFGRSLNERLISRVYVLDYPGFNRLSFASYDEAHAWAVEEMARPEDPPASPAEIEAADRLARRSYFSYSAAQIAAGEMAGGSPVANRVGLIRR